MKKSEILEYGREVILLEARNLEELARVLDDTFSAAVEEIAECKGRVVVTGMGKSGIIGKKIVATLVSTGTPSISLHPGEAIHGDLGMVCENDVVLAISNSGETEEILRILPFLKKIGARIVAVTSNSSSSLAMQSDATINTGPIFEADPFGLIPSSSTTVALVLGDAIACTLMRMKNFQKEDFAFFHPGGNLGHRLMLKVKDVMQTGDAIPIVEKSATLSEAIEEINQKNLGFTLVMEEGERLCGILTDGDLRRFLVNRFDLTGAMVVDCMSPEPQSIGEEKLAVQALSVMEQFEITCLVIRDNTGKVKGIVHLHDLLGKQEFSVE